MFYRLCSLLAHESPKKGGSPMIWQIHSPSLIKFPVLDNLGRWNPPEMGKKPGCAVPQRPWYGVNSCQMIRRQITSGPWHFLFSKQGKLWKSMENQGKMIMSHWKTAAFPTCFPRQERTPEVDQSAKAREQRAELRAKAARDLVPWKICAFPKAMMGENYRNFRFGGL